MVSVTTGMANYYVNRVHAPLHFVIPSEAGIHLPSPLDSSVILSGAKNLG